MELNKLEIQILKDIYDVDMNGREPIKVQDYELTEINLREKTQEFNFYLSKLQKLNFINYDESKAFTHGGQTNIKYNNNACQFWGDSLQISPNGIKKVIETRQS